MTLPRVWRGGQAPHFPGYPTFIREKLFCFHSLATFSTTKMLMTGTIKAFV